MCTYPVQPVCTSLLFILLFIKSQYTVFAHLICLALFILLHILLFISLFLPTYDLVLCYFYRIFICIPLHCPLSGPDLIYISLLIIPCIIYYVTNKEILTLTLITYWNKKQYTESLGSQFATRRMSCSFLYSKKSGCCIRQQLIF